MRIVQENSTPDLHLLTGYILYPVSKRRVKYTELLHLLCCVWPEVEGVSATNVWT